jgi:pimeloyl-ACP methyl ester carboxylesterase
MLNLNEADDAAAGQTCSTQCPSRNSALRRFQEEPQRGICDTGRYRCSYFAWGEGLPLFLIPGLVYGAWSYATLAGQLSKVFRCIGYDLPTGQDDGATLDRYGFNNLTSDLVALMDHLQVKRAAIFATSFGSMIAVRAAEQGDYRWLSMILAGGFAYRRLAPLEILAARLARHWSGSLQGLASFNRLVSSEFKSFLDLQPPLDRRWIMNELNHLPLRALAQRAVWMNETNVVAFLGKIPTPVALLYGDSDLTRTSPGAIALREGLTNVSEFILPDCSKHPILTHPNVVSQVVQSRLLPLCSHAASL